jgi:hypothetical protein
MIQWDETYKQLLTGYCIQCPENYYAPYSSELPHVGCCSYSPSFSLFEIHQMVKSEQTDFFWKTIYNQSNRTLAEFKIIIHARIAESYSQLDKTGLSPMQEEDLRLKFSVCQFFVPNKGCGLDPRFKNKTCRSFICSAVEERLSTEEVEDMTRKAALIRTEVENFNSFHEGVLRGRGWNFIHHMDKIINYFYEVEKGQGTKA